MAEDAVESDEEGGRGGPVELRLDVREGPAAEAVEGLEEVGVQGLVRGGAAGELGGDVEVEGGGGVEGCSGEVVAALVDGVALGGVHDEEVADEDLDGLGDEGGDGVLAALDELQEGAGVGVVEGQAAGEEGVEDDAAAPRVGEAAVVGHAADDLGGGVVRGAAGGEEGGGAHEAGHAKVGDLEGEVGGEQQVLGLEVAVADVVRVAVVEAFQQLVEELEGELGGRGAVFVHVIEELAALHVFLY